jgi:hypothetical protein
MNPTKKNICEKKNYYSLKKNINSKFTIGKKKYI